MIKQIEKRDGRIVDYDNKKIEKAIAKAMNALGEKEISACKNLALATEKLLEKSYENKMPTVEDVQDAVEKVLMQNGYEDVAKAYILYRAKRTDIREMKTNLMKLYNELNNSSAQNSDMKRDNANVDGDTAMGTMLKFGSEGAKDYFSKYVLKPEQAKAHKNGDIHIHDFDFYTLTETCCQIDIIKLFKDGFCTGHGYLREPNDIRSYASLACIAIQANQNDQHGGQSIPNFDYGMAIGVKKSYKKLYVQNFYKALSLISKSELKLDEVKEIYENIYKNCGLYPQIDNNEQFNKNEREAFLNYLTDDEYAKIKKFATENAFLETENATYQAMEALVHNLNTMHSRAGAQVPFSSINYGTDTSSEGKMVIKNVLKATEAGLGDGETPIFPIHIFKVKEGVNFNEGDPNYDLFKLACKVSAKRLFPNFSFLDAPFNAQYYKQGKPETETAYMGCRTRVIGNTYDPSREICYGRGNLSFTSINLPRLAILAKGNLDKFFESLTNKMQLVANQLLDRLAIQKKRHVYNYPFLMQQGIWIDSDKLNTSDEVGDILNHGTLTIGFIGLAETLTALVGKHHGESAESQKLGLKIIKFMRDFTDKLSQKHKLNFSLIATPAEGLSGRFVKMDKSKFGVIKGVTDKEYYTNSFHIPVKYPISAFKKIELEAPYHALTNGGHISYVELDGDTTNNVDAFEQVVRYMKEKGIGYGSINHPVDRCPICGYTGIIGAYCPKCNAIEGCNGYKPERIRRITGYLVGTLDRFNNAKRAEERDRVKHNV